MVGILIATHASLGMEIINASDLVFGGQKQIDSVGLYHGDNIEDLEGKIEDAVRRLDTGDGVLVFVDLMGGSPSNMTARAIYNMREDVKIECIAGVNLPLLIEALVARSSMSLEDLKQQILGASKESIVDLRETLGL